MDALKQKLTVWWDNRPEREQKILIIAGVLAVVALLHGYGYRPLADEHEAVLSEFQKSTLDYRWLKERVREIEAMGGDTMPAQESLDEMQVSLEKYLEKHGIKTIVERIEQRGKFFFEVRVRDASAVNMMKWMETLAEKGYRISRFRMENENGKLTGRVIVGTTS